MKTRPMTDAAIETARADAAETALALLFAESSTAIAAAMDRADKAEAFGLIQTDRIVEGDELLADAVNRTEKTEAALVHANAGWAAAGEDAWVRCIERDVAMADAETLARALHECLMCWTSDAPHKREWLDAALAAHRELISK